MEISGSAASFKSVHGLTDEEGVNAVMFHRSRSSSAPQQASPFEEELVARLLEGDNSAVGSNGLLREMTALTSTRLPVIGPTL